MDLDELKESIRETEEEIGIEIFVNVLEEKCAKGEEIVEKIERCEKLKREYVEKIKKLRQKSERNSSYDKVKADLIEEIDNLRKMKAKLENRSVNAGKEKAGATAVAASAEKKAEEKANEAKKKAGATAVAASAKEEAKEKGEEIAKIATRGNEEEIAKMAKRENSKEIAQIAKKENGEGIAKIAKRENEEEFAKIAKKENSEEMAKIAKRENSEEMAKIAKRENREEVAKIAKREKEEEIAKIAKRKNEEEIAQIAKKENGKGIAKIAKREKDEETAKIAKRKNGEEIAKIAKKEKGREIAKVAKREKGEEIAKIEKRENDKEIDEIAKPKDDNEDENVKEDDEAKNGKNVDGESDDEGEEKTAKIAKNEDESSNDESPEDGKVEVEGSKDEFARKSRKEHLADEKPVVKFEIVEDVLEHDVKLLSHRDKLDAGMLIEVAAPFPLLQAQRGESVAPSLNLIQSPTKAVEGLDKSIRENELEDAKKLKTNGEMENIEVEIKEVKEKKEKSKRGHEEFEEEDAIDEAFVANQGQVDDKEQKVARKPALIIAKLEDGSMRVEVMANLDGSDITSKEMLSWVKLDKEYVQVFVVIAARANMNVSAIGYNQFVEYVGDCENPDIKVVKDKLCFKGNGGVDKKDYAVKLKFLNETNPEKSKYSVQTRVIDFALEKKDTRHYWKRLLETKVKQHWLKVDFSKWKEEDDSGDESYVYSSYSTFKKLNYTSLVMRRDTFKKCMELIEEIAEYKDKLPNFHCQFDPGIRCNQQVGLELLGTEPQFSCEQRRASAQLSGGSERGVHGRGVQVERLEAGPQCGGHPA